MLIFLHKYLSIIYLDRYISMSQYADLYKVEDNPSVSVVAIRSVGSAKGTLFIICNEFYRYLWTIF